MKNRYKLTATIKKNYCKAASATFYTTQNTVQAAIKLVNLLVEKNYPKHKIKTIDVLQVERREPAINLSDNNYGVQAKQFKPTIYHLPTQKLQSC